MTARGRFITLEGSEGVGKTSNLAAAKDELESLGMTVVVTREPGGTPLAEDVRELLLALRDEKVEPITETLLMFAARAQHVQTVIEPALAKGSWVLCDRFTDATFAYQGGGRGVPMEVISTLAELAHPGLWPDLTLYLDVPVEAAFARIGDRDLDRFERERRAFFEAVRATYLERAGRLGRFRVVNAEYPLDEVTAAVRSELRRAVEGWCP